MVVLSRQRTFSWGWRIRLYVIIECINLRIWADFRDVSTESLLIPHVCLPPHKLDSAFTSLIFFLSSFPDVFLFLSFLSSFFSFYGCDSALPASVTVFLTLQRRILRLREVRWCLHGHTASRDQALGSGLQIPEVRTPCSVGLSSSSESSYQIKQL